VGGLRVRHAQVKATAKLLEWRPALDAADRLLEARS